MNIKIWKYQLCHKVKLENHSKLAKEITKTINHINNHKVDSHNIYNSNILN